MIMGYFDDSSTLRYGQDFVCLAGYLADDADWTALTKEWNVLLSKHEIPYLHLADFRASQGIYSELGWEQNKAGQKRICDVLEEFIFLIRQHTIVGIGAAIDALAFRDVTKGLRKREKPEVFCFHRVLRRTMEWLDCHKWDEPICLTFDDNKDYAMRCYSDLWEIKKRHPDVGKRVAGIAFGDDKFFIPLQAVDLLAYAVTLEYQFGSRAWSKERVFHDLLLTENPAYGKLYKSELWDKEELESRQHEVRQMAHGQTP